VQGPSAMGGMVGDAGLLGWQRGQQGQSHGQIVSVGQGRLLRIVTHAPLALGRRVHQGNARLFEGR
jgi:hypothetical protein